MIVTSNEPTTLSLRCDLASTTTVSRFRVVLTGEASMEARDANSGAPVSFVLEQGGYPVRSGVATIMAEAALVRASAEPSVPLRVGPGQEGVPLLAFTLENVGITGVTSAARVGRFAIALADSNGALLPDPSRYLERLETRGAGQILASQGVVAADGDSIAIILSPVHLTVNTPERFTVTASIADLPDRGRFRAVLRDSSCFVAADANTGNPVTVSYPEGAVRGAPVTVEGRAITLAVSGVPSLPPAAPGIRVDRLVLACRDEGGQLLVPSAFLDAVRIRWNGIEVASVGDLPSTAAFIPITFTAPTLEPGEAAAVDVAVDIDAGSPLSRLQLTLNGPDIGAVDANIATPVAIEPEPGQSLPLVSGLMELETPPREITVGLASTMPPTLAPDGTWVSVGTLAVANPTAGAAGSIRVNSITVRGADRDFQGVNVGEVVQEVSLLREGTLLATSSVLTPDSTSAWLPCTDGLIVAPGETVFLDLQVRLQDAPGGTGLRLGLEAAGIDVEQPSAALLGIAVRPAAGQSFPLWTEAASLGAAALEESYSNFPNPFAAGRENTTFAFYLPVPGRVTLRLWTPRGEAVRTLVDHEDRAAGLHQSDRWDGRNGRGLAVLNGVYVAELAVQFADGSERTLRRRIGVLR
jgi:hypothetical protein